VRRIAWLLALWVAAACDEPAPDAAEVQRRVDACCAAATARLEDYLGKKFKAKVPVAMKTREEANALLRDLMEREVPRDLVAAAQKIAERLRLVPPGYDLLAKQVEMLGKGVAGFYDPDGDCFYVVAGYGTSDPAEFQVTVAHELVHAYRDVDKDYWQRMLRLCRTNSDEMQALNFLVEGDATLLGYAIGYAPPGGDAGSVVESFSRVEHPEALVELALADPELAPFPLVLKEPLIAPYIEGQAFAGAIFRAGGKEALDKAFDRPPRSTEQALHPEKYLSKPDEPMVVEGGDPTAALGDGWRLGFTDVMGEFDLRVMFAERLGRSRARAAAAGWDGARYWFCEKEGAASFFGATTVWDAPEEAREFAQAWADWALARDGKEGEVGGHGGEWRVETADGLVVVRQGGPDVLIADGVPRDRVDAVLQAMAAARRVERRAE